jgi:hypothetical protein
VSSFYKTFQGVEAGAYKSPILQKIALPPYPIFIYGNEYSLKNIQSCLIVNIMTTSDSDKKSSTESVF